MAMEDRLIESEIAQLGTLRNSAAERRADRERLADRAEALVEDALIFGSLSRDVGQAAVIQAAQVYATLATRL